MPSGVLSPPGRRQRGYLHPQVNRLRLAILSHARPPEEALAVAPAATLQVNGLRTKVETPQTPPTPARLGRGPEGKRHVGARAASERPRVALIVAAASLRSSANNAAPRALCNPGADPKADLKPLAPASAQLHGNLVLQRMAFTVHLSQNTRKGLRGSKPRGSTSAPDHSRARAHTMHRPGAPPQLPGSRFPLGPFSPGLLFARERCG